MTASNWLIKSEPTVYAWSTFVKDGKTRWDGVRNFTARNNLRAMKKGDLCFFYHSGGSSGAEGKEIVGVARVLKEAYPDPTADDGDWSAVDVEPAFPMKQTVSLTTIKERPTLAKMELVRLSRLSVTKVSKEEFAEILALGKTKAKK